MSTCRLYWWPRSNPLSPDLRYTNRAAQYARYRWDYAPQAIDTVLEYAHVDVNSVVADIGSGTGILTRHFVGRVQKVYAVEPDAAMRAWAEQSFAHATAFQSVPGSAEATSLPDQCVDLLVVGQALHWFDAPRARQEFRRILRPGGYLAVLWNGGMDPALGHALAQICTPENGWDTTPASVRQRGVPPDTAISFYLNGETTARHSFPAIRQETWDEFFGALCSDSHAPEEANPFYANLRDAARRTFDAFRDGECVNVQYATKLVLGVLNQEGEL